MPNPGRALADRLVTYHGDQQAGFGRGVHIDDAAIAQIGLDDVADLNTALLELEEAGLLRFVSGAVPNTARQQLALGHRTPMILTLKGWDRYEQLKRANPESTSAFMAMQFNDVQMDRIYADHFRPAIAAIGFDLQTVSPDAGLIDYHIRLQVTASRFVLADLTHENRGVYFEAGYAEGIGRPVIFTCRADAFNPNTGHPHFDVNHHHCVRWSDPPTAAQLDEITVTIRAALLSKD